MNWLQACLEKIEHISGVLLEGITTRVTIFCFFTSNLQSLLKVEDIFFLTPTNSFSRICHGDLYVNYHIKFSTYSILRVNVPGKYRGKTWVFFFFEYQKQKSLVIQRIFLHDLKRYFYKLQWINLSPYSSSKKIDKLCVCVLRGTLF